MVTWAGIQTDSAHPRWEQRAERYPWPPEGILHLRRVGHDLVHLGAQIAEDLGELGQGTVEPELLGQAIGLDHHEPPSAGQDAGGLAEEGPRVHVALQAHHDGGHVDRVIGQGQVGGIVLVDQRAVREPCLGQVAAGHVHVQLVRVHPQVLEIGPAG